jgi:hypothetical protein
MCDNVAFMSGMCNALTRTPQRGLSPLFLIVRSTQLFPSEVRFTIAPVVPFNGTFHGINDEGYSAKSRD